MSEIANEGLGGNLPKSSRLWVEPVGGIIVARIRGIPTADSIVECQRRVVALRADTGCNRIMYDALELERPPIDIVLTQQMLTGELNKPEIRIAIVVPNTAIAYLARIAFGESNHRVFYNDITTAVLWLTNEKDQSAHPSEPVHSELHGRDPWHQGAPRMADQGDCGTIGP